MNSIVCTHLDEIALHELRPRSMAARTAYVRAASGYTFGSASSAAVACCDNSPNPHATAHAHATSHPIIRSLEPGEDWNWCYIDEVAFLVDGIRGKTRIPPSPCCSNAETKTLVVRQ